MNFLSLDCVYLLAASCCASLGAVFDLRTRRIPNLLTASSLAAGLLLHLATGGWGPMGLAAAAGLVGGATFFLFFVVGGMGAGDVKLMAAVACIVGFGHLAELLAATVLLGGLFAVVMALSHSRLKATLVNMGALIRHHGTQGFQPHPELNVLNSQTLRLPYGAAIAAGCWIAFLGQVVPR